MGCPDRAALQSTSKDSGEAVFGDCGRGALGEAALPSRGGGGEEFGTDDELGKTVAEGAGGVGE